MRLSLERLESTHDGGNQEVKLVLMSSESFESSFKEA
jgi:hypothetical protein